MHRIVKKEHTVDDYGQILTTLEMSKILTQRLIICSFHCNYFYCSNPEVSCSSLPQINLQKWQNCIDGGWSKFSKKNRCLEIRKCNSPRPNACGKPCQGSPVRFIKSCKLTGNGFK